MTTLILLTPHPGGLDYDLKNQQLFLKKCQSFDEHSWPSKFGKIWIAQKQILPIVNTLH
jgi:hypothetical protein